MSANSLADLKCSICINYFCEPQICDCGHSFCKQCIDDWMKSGRSHCPICRGRISRTTPNITLRQVVEERVANSSSQDDTSSTSSWVSLQMDGSDVDSRLVRGASARNSVHSTRSSRRCRFSDVNEIFSPSHSVRTAPSKNARPLRSAMARSQASTSPPLSQDSQDESDDEYEPITAFNRQCRLRRSEYIPRARDDLDGVLPLSSEPFKRESAFRRSVGVIRRQRKSATAVVDTPADQDDTVVVSELRELAKDIPKSKLKSFWKRLIAPKSKKSRLPPVHEHPSAFVRQLCSYSGTGHNFTKIGSGDEITIIVCGSRAVGKTSFLDLLATNVEASRDHRMIGLSDRLALSRHHLPSHSLAHLTSMFLSDNGTSNVIDVVDADCEDRFARGVCDSSSSSAFLDACDAAILMYSTSDSASLLTVMALHRRIMHRKIPCVLVANHFGNPSTSMENVLVQKVVKKFNTKLFELKLNHPDADVIGVVQHLSSIVIRNRHSGI